MCTIMNYPQASLSIERHQPSLSCWMLVKNEQPQAVEPWSIRIFIQVAGFVSSFLCVDLPKSRSWDGRTRLDLFVSWNSSRLVYFLPGSPSICSRWVWIWTWVHLHPFGWPPSQQFYWWSLSLRMKLMIPRRRYSFALTLGAGCSKASKIKCTHQTDGSGIQWDWEFKKWKVKKCFFFWLFTLRLFELLANFSTL